MNLDVSKEVKIPDLIVKADPKVYPLCSNKGNVPFKNLTEVSGQAQLKFKNSKPVNVRFTANR